MRSALAAAAALTTVALLVGAGPARAIPLAPADLDGRGRRGELASRQPVPARLAQSGSTLRAAGGGGSLPGPRPGRVGRDRREARLAGEVAGRSPAAGRAGRLHGGDPVGGRECLRQPRRLRQAPLRRCGASGRPAADRFRMDRPDGASPGDRDRPLSDGAPGFRHPGLRGVHRPRPGRGPMRAAVHLQRCRDRPPRGPGARLVLRSQSARGHQLRARRRSLGLRGQIADLRMRRSGSTPSDPHTLLRGAPSGWTNRAVDLAASATDGGSGMAPQDGDGAAFAAIRVDDDAPVAVPGPTARTTVFGEGVHEVAYYARDAAGNVNDGGSANGQRNRPPGGRWCGSTRTRPRWLRRRSGSRRSRVDPRQGRGLAVRPKRDPGLDRGAAGRLRRSLRLPSDPE